jgi:AcrR family transcriptional regulator
MSDEPTHAAKAAYHHGDLRAQLIEAVRDLVEAHGPDGFSVAEAARRAGVSSAAPYKHFKDRPEILRALAGEALDRLRADMEGAAAKHPTGSLEAVTAMGLAYVAFARASPGVFRLVFSLTEGHEDAPDLLERGQACFGVVIRATAARLKRGMDDPEVQHRAYMLWASVHGHSFLTIDRKTDVLSASIDDRDYLTAIGRAVLGTEDAG